MYFAILVANGIRLGNTVMNYIVNCYASFFSNLLENMCCAALSLHVGLILFQV